MSNAPQKITPPVKTIALMVAAIANHHLERTNEPNHATYSRLHLTCKAMCMEWHGGENYIEFPEAKHFTFIDGSTLMLMPDCTMAVI